MSLSPLVNWFGLRYLANYRDHPGVAHGTRIAGHRARFKWLEKRIWGTMQAPFGPAGLAFPAGLWATARTSCGWFVRNGWEARGHKILCPVRILHTPKKRRIDRR